MPSIRKHFYKFLNIFTIHSTLRRVKTIHDNHGLKRIKLMMLLVIYFYYFCYVCYEFMKFSLTRNNEVNFSQNKNSFNYFFYV